MNNRLELAPHIEDITRALGDTTDVEVETLANELQIYRNTYDIDLETAKQMIVKNYGGNPETMVTRLVQMIEELRPNMSSVHLLCRVLTIRSKEISLQNGPQRLWYGMLGDPSGVMRFTAWEDFGLERGDVIRIGGAYTREWRSRTNIYLNQRTRVVKESPDALPPCKTTVPTIHSVIADIEPTMEYVSFTARVLTVFTPSPEERSENAPVSYGLLADRTGTVPFSTWEDAALARGDCVAVDQARVSVWQHRVELIFDFHTVLEPYQGTYPGTNELTGATVAELEPGMTGVTVSGRILSLDRREVECDQNNGENDAEDGGKRKDRPSHENGPPRRATDGDTDLGETTTTRMLTTGIFADDSGQIRFAAFGTLPTALQADMPLRMIGAAVDSWNGPQLRMTRHTALVPLEEGAVPARNELAGATPRSIASIIENGGGVNLSVEGFILDIRDGSGLIMRCPECARPLRSGACWEHGPVEGTPDLRVKATVDDGTAAATVILDRELTSTLLDRSVDDCIVVARKKMSREAIYDEVVDTLVAMPVLIVCDARVEGAFPLLFARSCEIIERDVGLDAMHLLQELERDLDIDTDTDTDDPKVRYGSEDESGAIMEQEV